MAFVTVFPHALRGEPFRSRRHIYQDLVEPCETVFQLELPCKFLEVAFHFEGHVYACLLEPPLTFSSTLTLTTAIPTTTK